MGRGKSLSEGERASIVAHRENGLSMNEIARRIHRSRCVVQNFLKDPTKYGNNSAGGNNKKITSRDKRRLLAETSKSGSSSSDLREKLELPITPRHVRRLLAGLSEGHLKW